MIFENNGSTLKITLKGHQQLVYGLVTCIVGTVATIISLFVQQLPVFSVGVFFLVIGIVMVRYVETCTTEITSDGFITIEYKRLFGGKQWIRRLDRTDIRSLDYVKGFDDGGGFVSIGERWCTLYLNVTFDEQIVIAERYRADWTINSFGIPSGRLNASLDAEATEIGNVLNVPVNTISYVKIRDTLNSAYIHHDKMAPLFQRPSQELLDNERNVSRSNQVLR